jgi:hypothetical protein
MRESDPADIEAGIFEPAEAAPVAQAAEAAPPAQVASESESEPEPIPLPETLASPRPPAAKLEPVPPSSPQPAIAAVPLQGTPPTTPAEPVALAAVDFRDGDAPPAQLAVSIPRMERTASLLPLPGLRDD